MKCYFEPGEVAECLEQAAGRVLETMFYATAVGAVVDMAATAAEPVREQIGVGIEFRGAQAGRLELSLEREAARVLAANFLGEGAGDGDEGDCDEVMAELTNMVCGAMLSRLDREVIFCLDAPVRLETGIVAGGEMICHLRLEQGLLRLGLTLRGKEARGDG